MKASLNTARKKLDDTKAFVQLPEMLCFDRKVQVVTHMLERTIILRR